MRSARRRWAALLQAIRASTPNRVKRVIVTHYHADHFYGLEPFKRRCAIVGAIARRSRITRAARRRRSRSARATSFPWVDEQDAARAPTTGSTAKPRSRLGGALRICSHLRPAHSPEDVIVAMPTGVVSWRRHPLFRAHPFVAARTAAMARAHRAPARPRPEDRDHGPWRGFARSQGPTALTRDYLVFLRRRWARQVEDFVPFDEAYAKLIGARFAKVPAFDAANRINAYGTYLLMERELLGRRPGTRAG
jgi:hypothetical protein